jgi:hypothetical protein
MPKSADRVYVWQEAAFTWLVQVHGVERPDGYQDEQPNVVKYPGAAEVEACLKPTVYRCASKCGGNAEWLLGALRNCAEHWAGDHSKCKEFWPECDCSKRPELHKGKYAKDSATHDAVKKFFRKFLPLSEVKKLVHCGENYMCECFHAYLLRWAPKRLHLPFLYEPMNYCAAMDWNENQAREVTGVYRRKRATSNAVRNRSGVTRRTVPKTWEWKLRVARDMGIIP